MKKFHVKKIKKKIKFTRIFENYFFNTTNIVNNETILIEEICFKLAWYSLVNCEHTLLLEKRTIASNLKFNEWN